jgi:hypothetical protein
MTDKEILISKIKKVTGLSKPTIQGKISQGHWSKEHKEKATKLISIFEKEKIEYLERLKVALNG